MRDWDTDKLLGAGLVVALLLFLFGQFVALVAGYKPLPMELAGTIVTGLIGYMGKSLVDKLKQNDKPADSKPPPRNTATFDPPKR